jgi:hypothetical protein
MRGYTEAGQAKIRELAERLGFSPDAVARMLDAVARGRGRMAQFDHPDFGGSGQWMRGGMTMIGDMFNSTLKARVDRLCDELSGLLADGAAPAAPDSFVGGTPGAPEVWWPADLGVPDGAGSQNGMRYAYFAVKRRLAIDTGGAVTVYDTLHYRISGVSQQQSGHGTIAFSGPDGDVDIAGLPVISRGAAASVPRAGEAAATPAAEPSATAAAEPAAPQTGESPAAQFAARDAARGADSVPRELARTGGADILATIERLAELYRKGILSDEEFAAKKTELLARL